MESIVRLTGRLDPRSGWTADRCTIAKAMDVVGTRSALLLLREAFYGTTRFHEFAERVGISEPVAAARLNELVDHGLLERVPYREPGKRTRHGYQLTEKGRDFFPALVALKQWGDRWLAPEGGPVELIHRGCGATVQAELRCSAGHHTHPEDLDLESRPARPRRKVTSASTRSQ
ncbi:MAG: helix-turn-helix transcriptional regulator [Actinomycetota bacterium]|nr:helix-turn-helix transcriptional regulator [Actinomycetota bacterium]